jgi:hypothetical protein
MLYPIPATLAKSPVTARCCPKFGQQKTACHGGSMSGVSQKLHIK